MRLTKTPKVPIDPDRVNSTFKARRANGRFVRASIHQEHCRSKFSAESETQPDAVAEQQEQDKADRGAQTAENIRYGQTISEGGMGGKTTEAGGSANQGGYGSTDAQAGQDSAEKSRQEQGYGPGSGVGA
ncbi:MAG: hypothetical protein Q9188_006411 [Gyalolechia gomerana]